MSKATCCRAKHLFTTDSGTRGEGPAFCQRLACGAGNPVTGTATVGLTPGRGRLKGYFQIFQVSITRADSPSCAQCTSRVARVKGILSAKRKRGREKRKRGKDHSPAVHLGVHHGEGGLQHDVERVKDVQVLGHGGKVKAVKTGLPVGSLVLLAL